MEKVLVINAHHRYQGYSPGNLNNTLVDVIADQMGSLGCELAFTHIEQHYDVDEEVNKHLWADIIIIQAPVFWCALPWQHKKYLEEVFNAGLAQQVFVSDDGRSTHDPSRQYGSGGKMQGKQVMLSLTWNAPGDAFSNAQHKMFKGRNVDDLFANLLSVYAFCAVTVLPSFSCLDVIKAPQIEKDIKRLKVQLKQLISLRRTNSESLSKGNQSEVVSSQAIFNH
ncbi:MAG: NAD(P)H dehydrogenase (quinone) [Osedax symbiont Rs2]|nr:MAG: NAD(P)H dehydrogenase (quinone) [Osedax symbiont Rs2]